MNPTKKFQWRNYRQAWILSYALLYFPWFFWLEQRTTTFHVISSPVDDMIPFCEYFIIPYLLWFVYVCGTILYFLFARPKKEFYRMTGYLFVGMSICLFICTIFPNGLMLRPEFDPGKNIFTKLIAALYTVDTATNVFPSIHVFASVGIHLAIAESPVSKQYRWLRPASFLLALSIILSTMFLKQHSIIDVIGGLILSALMYPIFYRRSEDVYSVNHRAKWEFNKN